MDLTLPPEIQRFVDASVKSGRFSSPQDIVIAALASLMSDSLGTCSSEELEAMYPGFREKIAEGLRSAEAGELVDGEEFFAELEREEQELASKAGRKSA